MNFVEGKRLSEVTTLRIGGPARWFVEVEEINALCHILSYCREHKIPYLALGKGSNVLFTDRGFNGLVILNKIAFCNEQKGEWEVGAGYSFSLLGTQSARKGWEGLEFASGIPGSVGGAVYMNAGANGKETFQSLVEVSFVEDSGEVVNLPKKELSWGYRTSIFHEKKGVIAGAKFALTPSPKAREEQLRIIEYRTKTQPYGELSAGCIFCNPPHQSAGELIERCGLKGKRIGEAEVSRIHANFIINRGEATALNVLELVSHIQEMVKEKTGYHLETEIEVIPYV